MLIPRPSRSIPTRRSAISVLLAALGVVVLALGALLGVTGAASAAGPDRTPPDLKGPVGWDTYRHLDRIDTIPTGVETKQFSSFDRSGGNEDGFAGVYSCLQTTSSGCVIADANGPGEVESIWFTRDNGDVTRTGNLKIELDGRTVLDTNLQDLVDGKRGAPFVFPFVANADQSSGGVFVKVPMPYRSSMRITTQNNPLFYHVTYRTFSDARGVTTFDPSFVPQDVMAASATWGTKDPKPARPTTQQAKSFSLSPGATTTLADVRSAGEITALRLNVPQIVGPKPLPLIADDGRADKGYTQFTVAVDPANQGVKLTRRFDANSNHQVADVYVDGVQAGQWPATDDTAGYWSYQTITLPASLTAGKSTITVRNAFVSASIDWNEFHYWVDSVVGGVDQRTDELDVGTSPAALASVQAHAYTITNQTWTGTSNQTDRPTDTQDPAILASNELLRDVYVRVTFDDQQTVDSPLGEFFSTGLTESPVRSLFANVDTSPGGWYTSWWPMPFAQHAVVQLVNRSTQAIGSAQSTVDSAQDTTIRAQLRDRNPQIGYFNATHHRGTTVNGEDWHFLDTGGTGRFVGVSQTVHGQIPGGNIREYLEGDERVHADGSRTPAIHGTGTEDFYESGWYFNRGAFTNPMNGATAMPTKAYGCQYQCDSPYRLMIGDAVPFRAGMTFGIEHGPVDNALAEYSSTAYWYGFSDQAGMRQTDQVDVGDAGSRDGHAYTGAAAGQALTSSFEGDHDDVSITDQVASDTKPVAFTVKIDPNSTAVTLRRTSDQNTAYQSAQVTVDGKPAGTWLQPLRNTFHRWLDDTFQIDPALTAGKRKVDVTLTPTAGAPPWTASAYTVLSSGVVTADHRPPTAVNGLVATGTSSNAIQLSWNTASDNVGVDHYEVYGAKGTTVTPSTATLIGTTTLPSFLHAGLGLKEAWTYVVRAVDAAGNAGDYSNPATATSGDTLRVEGESLLPPVSATAPAVGQGNCCGVSWSGGAQLWFQGAMAGDQVTVTLSVPQDGSYAVTAALTQARDYGIVQVSVDGTPLGDPVDGYAATGVVVADHLLGTRTLTAGQHTLTLTVTSRNAAAVGWFAGLDVVSLRLAG